MPKILIEIDTDTQAVVPRVPTLEMKNAYYESSIAPISSLSVYGYKGMLEAVAQPLAQVPIPTIERLPTEADADPWGNVLAFSKIWDVWSFAHWGTIAKYGNTIWLPTGLARPAEPDGGAV